MMRALVIASVGLLVLDGVSRAEASVCSTDPGAFFCEDFEAGNLSGWATNGLGATRMKIAAPGLSGSNFKARVFNDLASGGYAAMDKGYSKLITNGTTFWAEWWIEYEPGFQWQLGCSCLGTNSSLSPSMCTACNPTWINSSFKSFDFRASNNGPSTCQERMLMTVWGFATDSPPYSRGHPQFSIYPNYCTGGTGNSAVGNDRVTEQFAPSFSFVAGHAPYHVIWEITSATGTGGSYRVWVDGVLIMNRSGLQTCGEPGGCTYNSIFLGGPQANSAKGQSYSYDQIRFTTTNIAPR